VLLAPDELRLWGDLAGGETRELWRWDGKTAEFLEVYCQWET
jgi:hypothetical protein